MKDIAADLKRTSKIPAAESPDGAVVFSFKYVDYSNKRFGLAIHENRENYTDILLDRLKAVCGLTLKEFTQPLNSKSLRSHIIRFEDTSEPDGFPILSEIWKERPWQFELTQAEYGRIHGFLMGCIFYVVWFDPKHKLYSKDKN